MFVDVFGSISCNLQVGGAVNTPPTLRIMPEDYTSRSYTLISSTSACVWLQPEQR